MKLKTGFQKYFQLTNLYLFWTDRQTAAKLSQERT